MWDLGDEKIPHAKARNMMMGSPQNAKGDRNTKEEIKIYFLFSRLISAWATGTWDVASGLSVGVG